MSILFDDQPLSIFKFDDVMPTSRIVKPKWVEIPTEKQVNKGDPRAKRIRKPLIPLSSSYIAKGDHSSKSVVNFSPCLIKIDMSWLEGHLVLQ